MNQWFWLRAPATAPHSSIEPRKTTDRMASYISQTNQRSVFSLGLLTKLLSSICLLADHRRRVRTSPVQHHPISDHRNSRDRSTCKVVSDAVASLEVDAEASIGWTCRHAHANTTHHEDRNERNCAHFQISHHFIPFLSSRSATFEILSFKSLDRPMF